MEWNDFDAKEEEYEKQVQAKYKTELEQIELAMKQQTSASAKWVAEWNHLPQLEIQGSSIPIPSHALTEQQPLQQPQQYESMFGGYEIETIVEDGMVEEVFASDSSVVQPSPSPLKSLILLQMFDFIWKTTIAPSLLSTLTNKK